MKAFKGSLIYRPTHPHSPNLSSRPQDTTEHTLESAWRTGLPFSLLTIFLFIKEVKFFTLSQPHDIYYNLLWTLSLLTYISMTVQWQSKRTKRPDRFFFGGGEVNMRSINTGHIVGVWSGGQRTSISAFRPKYLLRGLARLNTGINQGSRPPPSPVQPTRRKTIPAPVVGLREAPWCPPLTEHKLAWKAISQDVNRYNVRNRTPLYEFTSCLPGGESVHLVGSIQKPRLALGLYSLALYAGS